MFNVLFNSLYYVLSFSLAIFFIFLGVIGIMLPWSPIIRTDMIQYILENSIAISLFGFGFTVIGVFMGISLYLNTKRQYYYIRAGKLLTIVDEVIIQQYLESYWKQVFPQHLIPTRLSLKKNKIKIMADLPHIPRSEQKEFILKVEQDLQETFARIFGYSREFILALNFQAASGR